MSNVRRCIRCKKEKSVSDFYNEKRCQSCKDYYDTYYKIHRQREIDRAKNVQNKDRNKTNAYKRKLNRQTPLNICLQQARRRAKLKGVPFDITIDDLEIPDVCPVLGIPLQVNTGHAKENSYSLDRIIPERGYVKGNVAVISYKANTIKNNATIEDLEKVLQWLRSINDSNHSTTS
jgi:hypothetical protein